MVKEKAESDEPYLRADRLDTRRSRLMFIRSSWVLLEKENHRPSPTLSARESEWAKAEAMLKSGNSVFERNRIDSSVLCPKIKEQISGEKEKLVYCRAVSQSSTMPPNEP
ncbi:hypothetical protein H5410_022296 [Solanum commersonii]|uniref:Uncharacterized protein n=1 Tax=Solanum commersonii TaxID=4109 RepID=A0A9J5ZGC9_SOLCO|nr:hypothetical protein H5410_022296 [Solanum commersonii]